LIIGVSILDQLSGESELENVESQLVCHDGESVQGSHVSSYAGSYVLQWKFHVSPHTVSESPKAHIMYYTDYLTSAHYRLDC
jgi:hypothetical protein